MWSLLSWRKKETNPWGGQQLRSETGPVCLMPNGQWGCRHDSPCQVGWVFELRALGGGTHDGGGEGGHVWDKQIGRRLHPFAQRTPALCPGLGTTEELETGWGASAQSYGSQG